MSELYVTLNQIYKKEIKRSGHNDHPSDDLTTIQFFSILYFVLGYYDYTDIVHQFVNRQFGDYGTSEDYLDRAITIMEEYLHDHIGEVFSVFNNEVVFYPLDKNFNIFLLVFTNDLSILTEYGYIFPSYMFRNERYVQR
jgi:uncharacterized protein YheU (UPF0270 family)